MSVNKSATSGIGSSTYRLDVVLLRVEGEVVWESLRAGKLADSHDAFALFDAN